MLSKETLEKMLEGWKEALSLRDWEISLEIVPELGGKMGACVAYAAKKQATIMLVQGLVVEASEQERVLVEELLHLHYALLASLIPAGSVAEGVLEQGLYAVSSALVEMATVARPVPAAPVEEE